MSPAPLVVVSSDTHIGPLVKEQLRDYCPSEHLDDFDAFVAAREQEVTARGLALFGGHPNSRTAGHHDVGARLRDMNRDGIAAEVIFHGSQNGEPMPFLPQLLGNNASFELDPVLAPVGERIYNRWLADFCSVEPERHVGLAHVPMWDIDGAVREVEWAAGVGLRGVNFPAPRHGVYLEYNDRAWEPFWSACEACDMALATHVGVASPGRASGPESLALTSIEDGGYFARRAIWWMIFGGVFERHPNLELVITESPGEWWSHTMVELDSTWLSQAEWNTALRQQVPRRPSEYCESMRVTRRSSSGDPTTRTSKERGSTRTTTIRSRSHASRSAIRSARSPPTPLVRCSARTRCACTDLMLANWLTSPPASPRRRSKTSPYRSSPCRWARAPRHSVRTVPGSSCSGANGYEPGIPARSE
jgi:predicted TIM-barrel fold metal-dependent hydrolase